MMVPLAEITEHRSRYWFGLPVTMQRSVVILVIFVLLDSWSAVAQNPDPFYEAAPPSSTAPGRDPFKMAPATLAPTPKPPLRPEPRPEPVVEAPPPAIPTVMLTTKYDGTYEGEAVRAPESSGHCTQISFTHDLIVQDGVASYILMREYNTVIRGLVNADGSIDATRGAGVVLKGQFLGVDFTATVLGADCTLNLRFHKTQ